MSTTTLLCSNIVLLYMYVKPKKKEGHSMHMYGLLQQNQFNNVRLEIKT